MANEWRLRPLEEVAHVVMGYSPKGDTYNNDGEGVPLLNGPTEFGPHSPRVTLFTTAPSRFSEPGDILFCVRGSTGRMNWADKRYAVGRGIAAIRAKTNGEDTYFIYCCIRESMQRLLSLTSGSVFPNLSTGDINRFEIPWPEKPVRGSIVYILRTLDDKIELNRRMNRTLEKMAQAIFKSWFVDFDPVRAKAEGRDTGLPQEIADLFPDSFEDSEIGDIPKGWKASTVGDEFNLTMGQSPPGSTYNETGDGIPFFQGKKDFGFRYPSNRVYCTAPTRFAEKGDSLVSVRAPVGDANMALERCCVGRGVSAIRHKSRSRSYTYYSMLALRERFETYEANGTVFGSISKKELQALRWVTPPTRLVEEYERMVYPFDQRIEVNENQNRRLARLRDTLLPKLLSGEIVLDSLEDMLQETA